MSALKSTFFLSLRTILFGAGLAITALIYYWLGSENCWVDASPWWPVYGLFANLLSLPFIMYQLKKENVKLLSLVNFQSTKLRKDVLNSLLFILISIVLAMGSAIGSGFLIYGRYPFEIMPLFTKIPIGIIIAFAIVFPIVNSFIEEITYNGFIFQRLEKTTKSKLMVVSMVLLFFTLQHVFVMFLPDIKYLWMRLLAFAPLLLFWILIYNKQRRLTSLILTHWILDLYAILTIIFST